MNFKGPVKESTKYALDLVRGEKSRPGLFNNFERDGKHLPSQMLLTKMDIPPEIRIRM